jgi:putative endonuclease
MRRFVYVYVLVSEADIEKHYTGITRDLSERLEEHNRGHCPHTAKYKPWRIETAIAFASEKKARGGLWTGAFWPWSYVCATAGSPVFPTAAQ